MSAPRASISLAIETPAAPMGSLASGMLGTTTVTLLTSTNGALF